MGGTERKEKFSDMAGRLTMLCFFSLRNDGGCGDKR